jgi:LysM repeat protein
LFTQLLPNYQMKKTTITVICLLVSANLFASIVITNDSLANRNDTYIEHVVSADETMYSLLRKYNCDIQSVYDSNPFLNGKSNIYVNQKIKFPGTTSSIVSTRKSAEVNKEEVSTIHHVLAKETLYSISRLYDIHIEYLKSVNQLGENNLQIGQNLIIRRSSSSPKIASISSGFPDEKTPKEFVVPNAPQGEKISELGVVEVITTNRNNTKMLALHRTAPLGSLMTVKNEATGDRVVVKVIGKLPETGNNANVLVRLSPSAFYKLNPKDIKIRAEVAYFLPPNS